MSVLLRSVASETTAETIIRRSRFLSFLSPTPTKESALEVLRSLKHGHWDAAHHCYAYRLGEQGLEYRMSDDGEPSGTAGKPLLFTLQQANITNATLAVVRYFGGVKLGIGPLARAYAEAATAVIAKADLFDIVPMESMSIHCAYDDVSRIIELLQQVGASFTQHFADAVTFDVELPAEQVDFVATEVIERTNARAGFSKVAP
jgi:uncharacterized YigZ family protein